MMYTLRSRAFSLLTMAVLSMPLMALVPLVYTIFYRCVLVRHRHHSASLIITSCEITVLPNYNYVELSGTMNTVSSIHSCVHFKRPKLDMINTHTHSPHMSFSLHLSRFFSFTSALIPTVQTHTCTHT